jgi:hypothetical protein
MSLIGMPIWNAVRASNDLNDYTPTTLGFAWVEFKFPDSTRYPVLPVRTQNGLVFPLEGRSFCGAPEIALARELDAEISILQGVVVPTDDSTLIFGELIRHCIEERSQYPKKSFHALFWKEISNSTYGKLAQGLNEKRVFDTREKGTKPLPPSRITNAFFASFTTSFVRAVLGEIINSLPNDVMVFSCTTDGFITDATERQVREAQKGKLAAIFASVRKHLTGELGFLEIKHQIHQPLGWRTRGQATLKPGPVMEGDPTHGFILAKAGISVSHIYETVEDQNDYICDLFFKREPNEKITSPSLIGIRDIFDHEADLVETELTRRLNMEFDWKRRPFAIGYSTEFNHVVFSTEPWQNVEEFRRVRELWDEFQKKKPTPIKTIDDYRGFSTYAESVLLLTGDDKKYARLVDLDLGRLRNVICWAWHHDKGGIKKFVHCKDGSVLLINTAKNLANFLSSIGIKPSQDDVENAKKKIKFRLCPLTDRCKKLLGSLREFFPEIREEELFAPAAKVISLTPKQASECPFVSRVQAQAQPVAEGEPIAA